MRLHSTSLGIYCGLFYVTYIRTHARMLTKQQTYIVYVFVYVRRTWTARAPARHAVPVVPPQRARATKVNGVYGSTHNTPIGMCVLSCEQCKNRQELRAVEASGTSKPTHIILNSHTMRTAAAAAPFLSNCVYNISSALWSSAIRCVYLCSQKRPTYCALGDHSYFCII